MAKKVGRPARDPQSGAATVIPVRFTTAEKAEYQRAAEKTGLTLSEWVRDRLNRAAKRDAR